MAHSFKVVEIGSYPLNHSVHGMCYIKLNGKDAMVFADR